MKRSELFLYKNLIRTENQDDYEEDGTKRETVERGEVVVVNSLIFKWVAIYVVRKDATSILVSDSMNKDCDII